MDFEYDVFVPLKNNEGKEYPTSLLEGFKGQLIEKFGGLTDTRYRNEGTWKTGRVIQRDEIVIWRALSLGQNEDEFMKKIKTDMEKTLQQDEVLMIRRSVVAL